MSGHSIECRINAEDPVTFAPWPGTITAYNAPGGPGVRIETAYTQDSVVHPHYDSMIAKLIVHDTDRQRALQRMRGTLRELIVEGIRTNTALHQRVLDEEGFVAGQYDTGIVARLLSAG